MFTSYFCRFWLVYKIQRFWHLSEQVIQVKCLCTFFSNTFFPSQLRVDNREALLCLLSLVPLLLLLSLISQLSRCLMNFHTALLQLQTFAMVECIDRMQLLNALVSVQLTTQFQEFDKSPVCRIFVVSISQLNISLKKRRRKTCVFVRKI